MKTIRALLSHDISGVRRDPTDAERIPPLSEYIAFVSPELSFRLAFFGAMRKIERGCEQRVEHTFEDVPRAHHIDFPGLLVFEGCEVV